MMSNLRTHKGHQKTTKMLTKQECIPVGCVMPACCLYLPACTAWGVFLVRGLHLVPGGMYLVWGVHLVSGGTWSGGCTWSEGGLPSPGGVPTQVHPREQND